MNKYMGYLEVTVFLLYCTIPISLILGFIMQDGGIFMKTVFSFAILYFAYGLLVQYQTEES